MAIRLYDKESGRDLGAVSREQLTDLQELLEEESPEDADRFVNTEAIDYLEEQGADAGLIVLLRQVVGESEGVEVSWRIDPS